MLVDGGLVAEQALADPERYGALCLLRFHLPCAHRFLLLLPLPPLSCADFVDFGALFVSLFLANGFFTRIRSRDFY